MTRLAMVEGHDPAMAKVLRETGWTVVDASTTPLPKFRDATRFDLFVGEVRAQNLSDDIRRLAMLHALAPDLPMMILADRLAEADGERLLDGVIDIPIVRRGCPRNLLTAAIAAAT
jgi:hypothetical protein